MTDRMFRRQAIACLGTGISFGLAGCSGDGGGTTDTDAGEPADNSSEQDDDGAEEDGGATDTQSDTTPSGSGSTGQSGGDITVNGESSVAGLEFDSFERREGSEDSVVFTATIRNTGSTDTDLSKYNYEVTVYDSEGGRINGYSGNSMGDSVPAGESGTIRVLSSGLSSDVDEVARFEVVVNCEGVMANGVYCES